MTDLCPAKKVSVPVLLLFPTPDDPKVVLQQKRLGQ